MTYQAYIVELKSITPHPNADRLNIAHVFGMNVIVGKDLQVGDVAAYFPSDGQLSFEFAEFNNLLRKKDENGKDIGGYMDPNKRNVKAIRLRGEQSDGLIIAIEKVAEFTGLKAESLMAGDTFTTLNGKEICKKYIPYRKPIANNQAESLRRSNLQTKYPLFKEHGDTKHLVYNMEQFKAGDLLTVTLKLHGTSHRIANTLINEKVSLLDRIKNVFTRQKPTNKYEIISGSRRVILDSNARAGYYGDNSFRDEWTQFFDGKLHKGETVYGEIVGWYGDDESQTIMPSCDNGKLKDKEFVKKYGKQTTFSYGCDNGESDFYVYRMTMTNEDGQVVEYPTELAQIRCEQMGVKHAPVMYKMIIGDDINEVGFKDELLSTFTQMSEGEDLIDPRHIREGIIVRIENREEFTAFKHKNYDFKVLEGIIKEDAVEPDMEDAA